MASGSLDLRATGDRREGHPDRRTRPSVTIDAALVEAATLPAPSAVPVDNPAAPAAPAARTGRIAGTLQVAPSSGHRRSGTAHASGRISVEIDPELVSEVHLTAQADSPAVPLHQSAAPVASPETTETGTGTTPAPVGVTTAPLATVASVVVGPASASSLAAATTPAASGSVLVAASVANKTPVQDASVQLDPVLMAELGRLEKATTPVGPPDSTEPLRAGPAPDATHAPDAASAAPAVESPASSPSKPTHAAGATGTLSISLSSRSSAKALKTPQSGLSVALDPALIAEAKKLDPPKPRPAVASGRGSTGAAEPRTGFQATTSGKSPARATSSEGPAARPTARASDESHREAAPPGRPSGRISGTFNDIERDFFAREADLYKRETEDNFADLDEPASRQAKKNPSGRGPSKKRA
jgi:hypothetical protein